MSDHQISTPVRREQAQQVFRQFAWHLAGTIVKTGSASKPKRRTHARRKPATRK